MKIFMLSMGLIATLLVTVCVGQRFSSGRCPTFTPIAVNLPALGGLTTPEYAVSKGLVSLNWKCITVSFNEVIPGGLYTYSATGIHPLTNAPVTGTGKIIPYGNNGGVLPASPSAYFMITGDRAPFSRGLKYQVYAGDTNFFMLYHCRNLLFGKIDSAHVFTLATTPSADAVTSINRALRRVGLQEKAFYRPFENGCL